MVLSQMTFWLRAEHVAIMVALLSVFERFDDLLKKKEKTPRRMGKMSSLH
jgi:hypothetical protein